MNRKGKGKIERTFKDGMHFVMKDRITYIKTYKKSGEESSLYLANQLIVKGTILKDYIKTG